MTGSLQAEMPELILASASAARAAVLRAAGLRFSVQAAFIDEAAVKSAGQAEGASAEAIAVVLADLKAQRVARFAPEALVIGADQLLVCEDRWFDKPANFAEAREHLIALRGRTHVLVTAMVCHRGGGRVFQHIAQPRLTMRRFSDAFLDAYLTTEGEAVLGSVGAYRVEGLGAHLFETIEGEHTAILGLPLLRLLGFLRQHGALEG